MHIGAGECPVTTVDGGHDSLRGSTRHLKCGEETDGAHSLDFCGYVAHRNASQICLWPNISVFGAHPCNSIPTVPTKKRSR